MGTCDSEELYTDAILHSTIVKYLARPMQPFGHRGLHDKTALLIRMTFIDKFGHKEIA
jgi:hypothetical protein